MADIQSYRELIRSFTKLLGAVNLYKLDHPATRKSIDAFLQALSSCLDATGELILSEVDGKVLANGATVDEPFGLNSLFPKLSIHSITFVRGVAEEDVLGLLSAIDRPGGVQEGVWEKGVRKIRVNSVHYVKAGEEAQGGGGDGGGGVGTEAPRGFSESIERLPFEATIWKVVEKAVPDEEAREKVFGLVMQKFRDEVSGKIVEATSELRKEKEEIEREKDKTEGIISRTVLGQITVDNGGNVVMLNSGAERLVGKRLKDRSGRPVWEGLSHGQMVTYAPDEGGTLATKEIVVEGEDETKRLIQASNAVIRNVEGKMVGIFSVLSDMTRYRELERMKQDFVANVTHELRTPIVAVRQALSNVLTLAGGMNEDQRRMLDISLRNTERLLRLVNDLLDFSKLEAGKMRLTPELIETAPFLKEVVSSIKPFADSKGVNLVLNASGAMPRLFADRERTTQVLVNLLGNAIKFTDGGGTVTVETSGAVKEAGETLLAIAVRDTGRGIAPEDQARIFEKFVQAGDKVPGVKGTGLGLAITRSIVELHRGRISVESAPGKGSVFTVALPMVPEDEVYLKDGAQGKAPAENKGGFFRRQRLGNG